MSSIQRFLMVAVAFTASITFLRDSVPASTPTQADSLPHFSEKILRTAAFSSWSVGKYTLTVELFDDITVQNPSGPIGRDEHVTILSVRWLNQARER